MRWARILSVLAVTAGLIGCGRGVPGPEEMAEAPVRDGSALQAYPLVDLEEIEADPACGPVLLLGVDALTWDVLQPLLDEGAMPHVKGLMERGSHGVLYSAEKMWSPSIWTSVATGCTPEKHGITFFLSLTKRKGADGGLRPTGSDQRQRLALWNILSHMGLRSLVVGWMVSWPAEPILGEYVSDRIELERSVAPASLLRRFRRRWRALRSEKPKAVSALMDYEFEPDYGRFPRSDPRYDVNSRINFVADMYLRDALHYEVARELIQGSPHHLTCLYFRGTDIVSHFFWRFGQLPEDHEANRRTPDQVRAFKESVRRYYRKVDEYVGGLLEILPADATVLLVSDHGFRTQFDPVRFFDLNPLLQRMGYLEYKNDNPRLGPDWTRTRVADASDPINRDRRLLLNVVGRDPEGLIDPQEVPGFLGELKKRLLAIRRPDGRPAMKVLPAGPEGETPEAHEADLVLRLPRDFEPEEPLKMGQETLPCSLITTSIEKSGGHDREGVAIFAGPAIRQGADWPEASVYDVAPTALAILGLPVGRDMDGRVLEEVLRPELLEARPIRSVASYEPLAEEPLPEEELPDWGDVPAMVEQLQALGYMN